MNLTTRSKFLTGIAAAIGAYVLFASKEPDAVEPARAGVTSAAHSPHAAGSSSAVAMARSWLLLAHRVAEQTAAASLFAAHSWYVPPPPPPPVVAAPVEPPKPVAPPLPFQFIGRYQPAGAAAVFFLSNGDRVYDVHLGDALDNTYSVDSFDNGQLTLTYKPLNTKQQLAAGSVP